MTLTHFSLFSGIGGIDLAAEWAGFETVGQCEYADYPTKVLEKYWPNAPRWRDIRDVTAESFRERTGLSTVGLISGGFPCQPFSTAGKRKGKDDDRYLWPEMLRVIEELQPAWVLGENVAGIINMALDQVLIDLEDKGYEVQAFNIPACGVNASHRRYRVFIVGWRRQQGYLLHTDAPSGKHKDVGEGEKFTQKQPKPNGLCPNAANSNGVGRGSRRPEPTRQQRAEPRCSSWWAVEPGVGRVAHGVPNRVDRLKCLGNAVVPQQVYPILAAIAEIERSKA